MCQKDTLPPVQGRRGDAEVPTDLCYGAAVAEIGLQDREDEPQGVLGVGNECVFQESMGMPTGTSDSGDSDLEFVYLSPIHIHNVALVAAVGLIHASGAAGRAVDKRKVWEFISGVCEQKIIWL